MSNDNTQPNTTTMYVKFPRTEGFVIYPVVISASETEAETWDIYGSVTRYIESCPYPKIACLSGKPYILMQYTNEYRTQDSMKDYVKRHLGPWPLTGIPMAYALGRSSVLSYVTQDKLDAGVSDTFSCHSLLLPRLPPFDEFIERWNAFKPDSLKPDVGGGMDTILTTSSRMSINEMRQQQQILVDFATECDTVLCQLPQEFMECYWVLTKTIDMKLDYVMRAVYESPELLEECKAYAKEQREKNQNQTTTTKLDINDVLNAVGHDEIDEKQYVPFELNGLRHDERK